MTNALSVSLEEKEKLLVNEKLEYALSNKSSFVVFFLANNEKGTDEKEIMGILGKSGIEAVNILIRKELIKKENNRYYVINQGILIRTFESLKHHLKTYSDFYNLSHVGKERNYIYSLSDRLNLTGVKKVQSAYRKFHKELQEIYRDESNGGDIPSFSVGFADTFNSIENNDSSINKELMQ